MALSERNIPTNIQGYGNRIVESGQTRPKVVDFKSYKDKGIITEPEHDFVLDEMPEKYRKDIERFMQRSRANFDIDESLNESDSGLKSEKITVVANNTESDINPAFWEKRRETLKKEIESQKENLENISFKAERNPNIFKKMFNKIGTKLHQQGQGFTDKALEWGKKFTYVTLAIEGGLIVGGVVLSNPTLVNLGLIGVALDVAGLVAIKYIEDRRKQGKGLFQVPDNVRPFLNRTSPDTAVGKQDTIRAAA